MSEQVLQTTYNIQSDRVSDREDQSEYPGPLVQAEDGLVDGVVTDFPAVEVEVQVRTVEGMDTLTAVLSQEEGMEDVPQNSYQNGNSYQVSPQGELDKNQTVEACPVYSKTVEVSPVYVSATDTVDRNDKADTNSVAVNSAGTDEYLSKDISRNGEVQTSMQISSQECSNQGENLIGDVARNSVTKGKSPNTKLSTDKDNHGAASMAKEVISTPRPQPNTRRKGQRRQNVELMRTSDIVDTEETKSAEKALQKNLLWCEDCGQASNGPCMKHGALTAISDSHVPTYARLTLPTVLCIKKDSKGEGVFAKKYIKSRSQFGPLQAPFCMESNKKEDKHSYFYLKGYDDEDDLCQYNLDDEDECNWMMFVRPAQNYTDQNLVAYIYEGKVYYATIKPVEYGKELKVWYSADYAVKMAMSLFTTEDTKMETEKESVAQKTEDPVSDPAHDSEEEEDVHADSDDEFRIVEDEDFSDEGHVGTYCLACDTGFRSQEQLSSHLCKAVKTPNKRGSDRGATKRKGSPRKLTLDEDWVPKEDKKEVKVKRTKRAGRKSQEKTKSARAKKVKKEIFLSPRKKYQRTPKFTCSYCPEVFTAQDPYRAHEASHTGKSAYMCDHEGCGKGFETKFTYWRHMLCHKKPNDKQCPYCDRSFNRMDHLKTHLKTHDQQRFSYLCDKCGKSYLHKTTYDYHIALHEAKEGDSLTCMICGEDFSDKEDLIKHAHTHNRYRSLSDMPKTHPCQVCNRMFSTSKDVRRHMIVHTKEKRFLCELCPQTFGRKDHMRRHYKTNHSKETKKEKLDDAELPYSCELCQQKFAKKKQLANHKKFGHEQAFQPQLPRVEEHTLQQAAHDITEASVTSSSYNLYTLSTPQVNPNPVTVVQNQAAKALERYINTNVSSSASILSAQNTMDSSSAPVTYINSQANMSVNAIPQVREQCSDQLQQVKVRDVFQSDQMVSQRQQRQVPWTFVVEERDDHSYSTSAPPVWTPKVPNFRPTVSTAAEVETARLLQSAQSSHSSFPIQCNNATTMAVTWDTMTEYFPVQHCTNITEVVTSPSIVHQPQQQQQLQNQNIPQPQRGHLQQNHPHQ